MSIINRKLSKEGFSLIELMVAVIILAIAVLGIFLAFSSGWMGMANARDRTVATNFAREAMENVKNMDFNLVTNVNLGTAESVGAKFTRVIIVNTESDNLKEVNTKVFWTNSQGQYVDVETLMYINRTLSTPREAAKLLLYADPYYSVLPSATETIDLIAVIKDASGNTKIDWSGGNIRFNIISGSELGSLPDGASGGVATNDGIAETIFTPSNILDEFGFPQQGDVEIEAAVELPNDGGTISDIITITVTLGVVRVELSAVPYSIDADGTSTSTVTATLVDAGGGTVEDAPNDILFAISGEGTFVDSSSGGLPLPDTFLMSNSLGIATIYVESIADTPGVATVTASSEGLLSDTLNIITTGVATFISVTVNPELIYTDDTEGARVTVEIQDVNGNPVEYSGDISLATSDGTGIFEPDTGCDPTNPNSLCFDNVSSKYTTFSSASPGIVTITASGGDLTAGNTTIEVRDALIADTIIIKAIPKNIFAGGIDVSEITATIKQGSTLISNYNNDITFEIVSDTSSSQDASLSFNSNNYGIGPFTIPGGDVDNGEVVVYLNPASDVGICIIKVSTVNSLGTLIDNTIEVGFYSIEDHIELSAVPSKMLVDGGNCTVTATVVDENGTIVNDYNEDITFTILVGWPKIVKFVLTGTSSLTQTLSGGDTTVELIPQSTAGTVTLKASSFTGMTDITGYLNIPVNVTLINLVEDSPAYSSTATENIVTFEIEVQGAEVALEEMQVSWSPNDSETLNTIYIETSEVYSDVVGVVSGTVVDIIPTNNLPAGISTINLYFDVSEVMSGKTFNIIFNPSSEYYAVEFVVP